MTEQSSVLKANNEQIVSCIAALKEQRDEINILIVKQEEEREELYEEMERIKYKLSLIAKSLGQRVATRDKYDQTIREAELFYDKIVQCSCQLLGNVQKGADTLEEAINKKVGTEVSRPAGFATANDKAPRERETVEPQTRRAEFPNGLAQQGVADTHPSGEVVDVPTYQTEQDDDLAVRSSPVSVPEEEPPQRVSSTELSQLEMDDESNKIKSSDSLIGL